MIYFVGIDYCNMSAAGIIYDHRQATNKKGGLKHGNYCNFGRHYGRKWHCMHCNAVRAASLDGRENESEKMAASQF